MSRKKTNQTELSKLSKGESVNHFLLVKKCEVKTGKNIKNYLSLELGDATASLSANVWDNYDAIFSSIKIGNVVNVQGVIDEYQGQLQIRVKGVRSLNPDEIFSAEDFLPTSKRKLDEMEKELWDTIEAIQNPYLLKLLKSILQDEIYQKYIKVPAGKSWHHSYIHGLLEHTLEIIKICKLTSDFHPEVNSDLLITGAILHDFGKTKELTFSPSFDYSDVGRLLGHIVIAAMDINRKCDEIIDFPESLKNQLLHLVLSHQGKLEQASPVVPKTLEAIILYHADELSAKANAYKSAIGAEAKGDNNWTKYIQLISSQLYIPEEFNRQ
ncbi:MAG: HD domain-containing protein [Ignavibacteriales bacterium]|nr:HD domain-containing protein [Ignavibacteriales bacterium]